MMAAILRWLRQEIELALMPTWDDGRFIGPPDPPPLTRHDPRCQRTIERLAQARAELRGLNLGLLDAREVPADFIVRTDVAATFAAIARRGAPTVRLVRSRGKK